MALTREQMAQRVAQELQDGFYVNLGIGIPTLVANYVPEGIQVMLQSENGLLGMGVYPSEAELDPDMINAGKQTVTARVGASIFDSADSFAMIRGGHIDLTVLGAFEVDVHGNIASWMVPGKLIKGMGGAMDLVAGAENIIVTMTHASKDGESKLLMQCSLPLTGGGWCIHTQGAGSRRKCGRNRCQDGGHADCSWRCTGNADWLIGGSPKNNSRFLTFRFYWRCREGRCDTSFETGGQISDIQWVTTLLKDTEGGKV